MTSGSIENLLSIIMDHHGFMPHDPNDFQIHCLKIAEAEVTGYTNMRIEPA